jgi:magnesium transporter
MSESPPASSSLPSGSPIRRRRNTVSDVDQPNPRLSPTLSRSNLGNDLQDPQILERQRTMDVDMAIQMAKARREIDMTSPVSPAPKDDRERDPPFSAIAPLSPAEQREIDVARGHDGEGSHVSDPFPSIQRSPVIDLGAQLREAQDPSLLVSFNGDRSGSPPLDNVTSVYQPVVYRYTFDFASMEQYAKEERARLGVSPTALAFPFSPSVRRRPQPTALAPDGTPDEKEKDQTDPVPNGQPPQRKVSSDIDTTVPRIPRKAAGGKLALFEGSSGIPPPSLHEPFSPFPGSVFSADPSSDFALHNIAGTTAPSLGILHPQQAKPYRFSFYSNALSATIHSRSLSELPAEGQSFEELFTGVQPASSTKPENVTSPGRQSIRHRGFMDTIHSRSASPAPGGTEGRTPKPPGQSLFSPSAKPDSNRGRSVPSFNGLNGLSLAATGSSPDADANTWWLDVLNPTDEEMKLLSKVFGIHPLTVEDILMEEAREKIELFRSYYFVCFRSFEQDPYSPTHLEPLNMYIIVFREGTISVGLFFLLRLFKCKFFLFLFLQFHFRTTPHPQNVRRRIKQLKDYISVTSDWISYALIDDITDAFGPLIQSIEYEVDSIDELVLILKEAEQSDMLRRIGRCRKKVMGLLRLMGNKADVVKGLAKRCNEHWQVAPTSDIGLYLSDIQDHLITMTQNLNHYEKILSRSHSNYLAQISIEMTEANNQINDVLSKLTALGTVLIPMNLVTGLWGMNVHVPGQNVDGYAWFLGIIGVLAAIAILGGALTYRFMVRKRDD